MRTVGRGASIVSLHLPDHQDFGEPCIHVTDWLAVTTHTRTPSQPSGPDYCLECSEAVREWVSWPCERSTHPDPVMGDHDDTEALAEDYTACGMALIGMNLGSGGTAKVNVYCELPVDHEGTHAAAIEWDHPPHVVRVAQGSEKLLAARVAEALAPVEALAAKWDERAKVRNDHWTPLYADNAAQLRAALPDPQGDGGRT
jgi:hypothetical protein